MKQSKRCVLQRKSFFTCTPHQITISYKSDKFLTWHLHPACGEVQAATHEKKINDSVPKLNWNTEFNLAVSTAVRQWTSTQGDKCLVQCMMPGSNGTGEARGVLRCYQTTNKADLQDVMYFVMFLTAKNQSGEENHILDSYPKAGTNYLCVI